MVPFEKKLPSNSKQCGKQIMAQVISVRFDFVIFCFRLYIKINGDGGNMIHFLH